MAAAERPILYSAPMVRSVLRDTDPKTQTRRIVKWCGMAPGLNLGFSGLHAQTYADGATLYSRRGDGCWEERTGTTPCPYGKPGDRLWVRETWAPDPPIDDSWASTAWNGCGRTISEIPERFHHPRFCNYAADWLHGKIRWTPSIHMPRWASRITLEITEVRVQRLQEISEADAKAEGIERLDGGHGVRWLNYLHADEGYDAAWEFAKNSFASLFDSINGPGSWAANPWVWAISFTRVR